MNVFSFITNLIDPVTKLVDEVFTSDEEKKNFNLKMAQLEEKRATDILNFQREALKQQAAIIQSEVTGNWLQRSWRPILMLAFGFIIIYQYFIAHVFGLDELEMPDQFWTLLEIGIGGYLVGRSVEKVAPKLVEGSIRKKEVELKAQIISKEIEEMKTKDLSTKDLKKLARVKKREQRFLKGRQRREARAQRRED